MPRIQLTTFLANDVGDSSTKASKMAKYADAPGGSDYYWGSKAGLKKLVLEGNAYDEAVGVMGNMTVSHQRISNQTYLLAIYHWLNKRSWIGIEPPTGEFKGPLGELTIKLEPAFGIETKGRKEAYVLWTYKDLRLSRAMAGMGALLLIQGLKAHHPDWDFYILDTVTMTRFGETCIQPRTNAALTSALHAQEPLFKAAKAAA